MAKNRNTIDARALRNRFGISAATLHTWIKQGLPRSGDGFVPNDVAAWLSEKGLATPTRTVATIDQLSKSTRRSIRQLAYDLAKGMPGEPGYYDLDAAEAWLAEHKPAPPHRNGGRTAGALGIKTVIGRIEAIERRLDTLEAQPTAA